MKRTFTLLALIALCGMVKGQYIEKNWFNSSDSVYGYYTSIKPSSGRIQGVLVLLDGYSGNADNFLSETKIHNVASANDILTICVPTGQRLYLDSTIKDVLNRILKETLLTYHLRKDQFAIGGMSAGGVIAMRYVELTKQNPSSYPVQFSACFAVDSPLDLAGLYKSSQRDLRKNMIAWWLNESQWIINRLYTEVGDPNTNLEKYKEVSPFVREAPDSTNEKLLRDVAVRTYHDVDIEWHLKNRNRSFYETNMLDGSELISRLMKLGNKDAEFMAAKTPGRKSDGTRFPHSWSIVDEIELVQWLKAKMNFYPDHLNTPFSYQAPTDWNAETILFPIDFAPSLPYKGFEQLWFAPGWGDPNSNEKWAYTILWWLDAKYSFDEKILKRDLESYFSGLTRRRAVADKLDLSLLTPAKVEIKKVETLSGDKQTFSAFADIFDAQVSKKPGKLYFKIHEKNCPDAERTIVLFEVSANPTDQAIWKKLDQINSGFKCVDVK